MTRRTLRTAAAAVAAAAAVTALVGAAPASAGPLAATVTDCDEVSNARVFLPWADPAEYFLAPDGGFEAGAAGWALRGASVVAGNEPYAVSGPGARSLRLVGGQSATSPTFCVGIERPTVRFFVRKAGGGLLATLRADVHYVDGLGTRRTLPAGTITASGAWHPSPVLPIVASLLPLLPGERTPVQLTLTAQGGDWQVDDLHVDPYGSR